MNGDAVFSRLASQIAWLLAIVGVLCVAVIAIVIPLSFRAQTLFAATTIVVVIVANRASRSKHLTIALCIVSVIVSTRYLWWRTTETLHFHTPMETFLGIGLYMAEIYAWLILLLGYLQTAWPLQRPVRPLEGAPATWPKVDVFIPTYNESLEIVQDTVLAAMSMDYPRDRFRVYLLDDGKRPEFRTFAEMAGATYVTRPDNKGAKAGNLNHALERTDAELVCIFDCDHIPTRAFLQMTVGWFQEDARLALLQTPHHFYSPDPVQRNIQTVHDIPGEGDLFYGVVQPGNDLWNAAFFCGSCAVLRRSALDQTEGFAHETVTEDAHTALKLQRLGWNTAFLEIRLSAGLATERLALHIGQRIRWARGMTQIFRIDNPLMGKGLTWPQRLCYLNAMLHFQFPLPRIVFLTSPLAFLLGGANIISASAPMILAYALPHLVHSIVTNNRMQGEERMAFWGEIYETLLAFHLIGPTLVTMIDPKRGKFNVTDKGGRLEKGYFDWPLMWPHVLVAGLLILGLALGTSRLLVGALDRISTFTIMLNTVWTLFSLLVLLAAISVGRETRQIRNHVRVDAHLPARLHLSNGEILQVETRDISMGGLSAVVPDGVWGPDRHLEALEFSIEDRSRRFDARTVMFDQGVLRVQFLPLGFAERRDLVRTVLGRADAWQPNGHWAPVQPLTALAGLVRASASILFRRRADKPVGLTSRASASGEAGRISVIVAGLALTASLSLGGKVSAQAIPNPANPPPASSGAVRTLTLKDLGFGQPLQLRGVQGEAGAPFTLRRDEVVTGARLVVSGAFSPALLGDLSQLAVSLNGEPAGAVMLTPDRAGGSEWSIPIDPALFLRDNQLNLRFLGHYTRACEDPQHSSLWMTISNQRSRLELTVSHLPLAPNLAALPGPFFDPGGGKLVLPFVFAEPPSDAVLRGAGAVASYFGMKASYRGFGFPTLINALPSGEGVVFGLSQQTIGALTLPTVTGPTLAVVVNPQAPDHQLLLVLGRDGAEIRRAALALSIAQGGLSGASAQVDTSLIAPRAPYDAPRWLPMDRPVRFGELVEASSLRAPGLSPGPVNVPFRVAPDLFLWPAQGAPVTLRYRYPKGPWFDREQSRLDISLNNQWLRSYSLTQQDSATQVRNIFNRFARNEHGLILPPYLLFGSSQLQFYFDIKANKTGACQGQLPTNFMSGIDPDSSIDLTHGRHFASLPNLAFFASAGFPFTRNADLDRTTVILEPNLGPSDIEAFLGLMGRFGDVTGAPVTRVAIARTVDGTALKGRDVLLLGRPAMTERFPSLFAKSPFHLDGGVLRLKVSSLIHQVFLMADAKDAAARQHADELLVAEDDFDGLVSFRSPFDRDRAVVAILSSDPARLPTIVARMDDPIQNARLQGDLSIVTETGFSSFHVGDSFQTGDLPLPVFIMWWLSQRPIVLALAIFAAGLVLSVPLIVTLRLIASRRLKGGDAK
ncbi:UDP-forming cellulose synthase catalytic subunit [Caulobacter soli]|uniref:UDP-forming cellulose synthase catalytic subunit n=1 Tax=Caulobacter soli TaxID=2708539 RepID=UPI0013EDA992|nr:UDP-forming cellulose synthase catalytic subunit [Caulobacter soli]